MRLIFITIFVFVSGCAPLLRPNAPIPIWTAPNFNPNKNTKLALIVEDNSQNHGGGNPAIINQIEGELNQILLSKGYRIAARTDIEKVLREIKFQHSGWTESNAAQLGRMLNVSSVVIISIGAYSVRFDNMNHLYIAGSGYVDGLDANITLSGRIISVEEAEIIGQANYVNRISIRDREEFPVAAGYAARMLFSGFPPRNR